MKPVAKFDGYVDGWPVIQWLAKCPAGTLLYAAVECGSCDPAEGFCAACRACQGSGWLASAKPLAGDAADLVARLRGYAPDGDRNARLLLLDAALMIEYLWNKPASAQPAAPVQAQPVASDEREARELARADQSPVVISNHELASFHRFCDCCEDFDAGGHDVPKAMVSQLVRIGLLRPAGPGRHETTKFGDWLRDFAATQPAVAPAAVYLKAAMSEVELLAKERDELREFAEAIATNYSGMDNQERLNCYGCEADLDDHAPHKPGCIVLRAQAILAASSAPAAAAPEGLAKAAQDYLDCVNGGAVELEFATAASHTHYDRVRYRLQRALGHNPAAPQPAEGGDQS